MALPTDLQFLLKQTRPYRGKLGFAVALLMLESAVMLALPWFAGHIAQALLAQEIPSKLLLIWLLVMGLQALITMTSSFTMGAINQRVTADLGLRVYEHLQALPLPWHQQRQRGEVLAFLHNDVWYISQFISNVLIPLLPMLLSCLGALILLCRIEPVLGLIIAFVMPVFFITVKLLTRSLRPLANLTSEQEAKRYGISEQNLGTLPIIKAFTREREESARYGMQTEKLVDLQIRQLRITAFMTPAIRWVMAAGVIGLLWLGATRVAAGSLTAPELITLLLYGLLLTNPLSQLADVYGRLQMARGSATRLMDVLNEDAEIDTGTREISKLHGDIRFENIDFTYPGRPELLKKFTLHIPAGQTLAITGVNGAGKSTLTNLLLRFIVPNQGNIIIDGINASEIPLRQLRSQIGLVSQQVLLFNASVGFNIGYGKVEPTQVQIEAAARAAHAHDFIQALPDGYNTIIGDEGVRLSGGQKQRIALARALLKDPAILILDEATAMFDPEGERSFIAECHDLLRSRTVLLITHRPASLALADRVIKLEAGRWIDVPVTNTAAN
ncbi:MAG: ABC transporter ATP-binding protein [Arenimonas sp.]